MATPERVVLFDGSALIYRAFYAIPSKFRTKGGLPTNAVYGFAMTFNKLLSGRTPDRGAVVFDAPGRTFRDDKYPAYKAQRSKMPDELREQLSWIDKVVDAYRFEKIRVPGFEADDVIGTLTRQAIERGMEVVIVSGDKDFAQLIGDDVKMLDTFRDITYDAELVRKKWGVPPERFIDLLALMGDKIDNIPGVPGIGQKGAAQLLDKYKSLEGVLAHVDDMKGKRKENLIEHADDARLSRELATIDQHVPLELGLDDIVYRPPERTALNTLYKELEFFSLLSDAARDEQAASEEGEVEYEIVSDAGDLARRLDALGEGPSGVQIIFDLPYVVRGRWVGVAIAASPRNAFYVPISEAMLPPLKAYFEDAARPKVAHNVKQLIVVLARHDIALAGVAGDTMLASFLVDPEGIIPHRLDQVTKQYLQRTIRTIKSITGSGQKERALSDVPLDEIAPYASHLADAVVEAWPAVLKQVEALSQTEYLFKRAIPLSRVLARMELRGINVDAENLEAMGIEFTGRLKSLEQRIYELAGHEFNIQSTQQLGVVLFDELELPVIKRTKSGYSTNAEVLERLRPKHEIAQVILDYRKLAKLINTYTDVLQREVNPETGRIHASFQQTAGVSGRLITTDPDLQRTPVRTDEGRRIREAFVPVPGFKLISADWSQIELRVLAHFCQDPVLVESFRTRTDVHLRTASELFHIPVDEVTKKQREVGKTVNFATIYGQGATALGQILGIPRKEAKAYIDGYFETYAAVRQWRDDTIANANETGIVTTILGRRREIAELKSNNWMDKQAGERIAVNTPIQGSAADICKLAMLAIDEEIERRGLGARMLLQVHDELVFEVPEGEVDDAVELIRRHMESACELAVPLVVDIGVGMSWAEAH